MKTINLHGALAERVGGNTFQFDVNTPAEAIRALTSNFKGLDKWLVDSAKDGIAYKVLVGKTIIDKDNFLDLGLPYSDREIFEITPVITGSGRGFTQLLIGAALIGASFMFPGAGMFGTVSLSGKIAAGTTMAGFTAGSAMGTALGTMISSIGASMVLSGIAEIISPTQPFDLKEVQRSKAYTFSGLTNTAQAGVPVPIVYGRVFCGSAVISADLDVDQLL